MSQILDLLSGKGAFGQFEDKAVVGKNLKGFVQVFQVIRKGFTIDQDIVEEDDNEVPLIRPKIGVHSCLKGRKGVAKPKRHYQKFIMAVVRTKSHFVDVLRCH